MLLDIFKKIDYVLLNKYCLVFMEIPFNEAYYKLYYPTLVLVLINFNFKIND